MLKENLAMYIRQFYINYNTMVEVSSIGHVVETDWNNVYTHLRVFSLEKIPSYEMEHQFLKSPYRNYRTSKLKSPIYWNYIPRG
jgi:hypothetical protein